MRCGRGPTDEDEFDLVLDKAAGHGAPRPLLRLSRFFPRIPTSRGVGL